MSSMNPAQLEKCLKGVNYPASKAELVKHMERNSADECVRQAISCLPNLTYDSSAAISRAISAAQQGTMQQDQDQDQDHNHQDQSQWGKQKANR